MSELDASLINRAAPPGSMRYFAALYTPPALRTPVLALYVIEAEIRESAASANHDVAHTRLTWWRAELDRLVNGSPQHPATRALHEAQRLAPAELRKLHELVVAADMDLARMTYASERELGAYCVRSSGVTQELSAALLHAPRPLDEAQRAAASRLGIGIRQAEIVRDLRRDAHGGRVYLPLDLLERHELRIDALHAREIEPRLKHALRALRESADAALARPPAAERGPSLRPVLVLAALHRRLLERIAARDYDVARERLELGALEKPWVAWREARRSG